MFEKEVITMVGIRKYDPYNQLSREFDRMISRFFDMPRRYDEESEALAAWYPRMDVNERENELVIRFDLPGMKREDIQITVENNTVTVNGERKFDQDEKQDNYHRVECCYGRFTRSFTLPRMADGEKMKAKYTDGVLELILPKREEAKPKQISINAG